MEEGEGERRWTGVGRRRSDEQKHYTRLFGKGRRGHGAAERAGPDTGMSWRSEGVEVEALGQTFTIYVPGTVFPPSFSHNYQVNKLVSWRREQTLVVCCKILGSINS